MGGLFSGISRERRLDKLQQLVLDIKRVKSDLASEPRKRKLFMWYTTLLVVILMPIISICSKFILDSSWITAGMHSCIVLLIGILVYAGSKYYYDRCHRQNLERLAALKEEKSKILEVIKNTESYAVVKEVLDQCGSDEETEAQRHQLLA